MGAGSVGNKRNNMVLSSCSIDEMSKNLNSLDIREGGSCWIVDSGRGSCGNSIVEVWEECDCGDDVEECERQCCVPPNDPQGRSPCKLVQSSVCSPSEGLCCNSTCQFLSSESICLSATDCSEAAKCTGQNAYCPLPTPLPNDQTCQGGSKSCQDGQCTGSICQSYGMLPCPPPDSSDPQSDCQPYCHAQNSECAPVRPQLSYSDGTECAVDSTYGYCISGECALYKSGIQTSSWLVGVALFLVFYSLFLALSIWIYCRYCRNTSKTLLPVKTSSSSIDSAQQNQDSS